ncbi:unnamed protein product, partial [Polarella glacialis]
GSTADAELQLLPSYSKACSEAAGGQATGSFLTLSRLSGAHLSAARLKVLLTCSDGARLQAVGHPLWVLGRLEGALRPMDGQVEAKPEKKEKKKKTKKPQVVRPKNLWEYSDWLEAYLKEHGRTTMRRLGTAVNLPPGVKSGRLKRHLLKNRDRFMVAEPYT